jgi:hypothetical protein
MYIYITCRPTDYAEENTWLITTKNMRLQKSSWGIRKTFVEYTAVVGSVWKDIIGC